jgi:two-component system, chemotaxis family, protein-glutamate methylesterase/glutaminase
MPNGEYIVVIGTSAGGNIVLPELLKQFPPDMPAAVFVVTHMAKHAVADLFVKRAQKYTSLTCKIAANSEPIRAGHVYFSKPDHHLLIKEGKIILGKGPMENRYRPSIDALFRSAAAAYGNRVIGIVLTGLLEDGAAGLLAIKRSGGKCIIQDPNEAQYPDMPNAALKALKPDYIMPVKEMGKTIESIMSKRPKKTKIPEDVIKEADIAERVNVGIEQLQQIAEHSLYSCPDCGGGLWQLTSNGITRYRCHVGHAYTEDGLLSTMQATTESALWTAIRIIEERRNLLKSLSEKEKTRGSKEVASRYKMRMQELEDQITQLRRVLFTMEAD